MQKILLVLVFVLLSVPLQVARAQTNDPIASIRQQYLAINRHAPKLRKVKKELLGYSLEGSQLLAYFDGPLIVKIKLDHYGEMGSTLEEYYYSDGKLIFLYEKVSHYNRPLTGRVIRTVEQRYYFNNDKLIRWLDEKGKQQNLSSEDAQAKEKETLELSNSFVAAARSRQNKIEK